MPARGPRLCFDVEAGCGFISLQLIHVGERELARMFLRKFSTTESLILAQNERWRRGLGMQVERERGGNSSSRVANG